MYGDKVVLARELKEKFRLSGLTTEDRAPLFRLITTTEDQEALASLVYIFGRSFPKDDKVAAVCGRFLKDYVPGLTASCMKTLIDFWGLWDSNQSAIAHFLDVDLYELWYDEVIFSANFVSRNRNLPFTRDIVTRYNDLIESPEAKEIVNILKLS